MSKGKYSRKSGFCVRPIALVLAAVLLMGASIGGTLAWLTAKTDDVVNTFTVGDVNISLKESELKLKTNGDVDYDAQGKMQYKAPAEGADSSYPLIPGNIYKKDPVVTVTANSEKCYLFVEVIQENDPGTYLEYTLNTGDWTTNDSSLPANVWYKVVEKSDKDQSWHLITNDYVKVSENIVKKGTTISGSLVEMPVNTAQPKLAFKAYAVQFDNMANAADAWAKIPSGT